LASKSWLKSGHPEEVARQNGWDRLSSLKQGKWMVVWHWMAGVIRLLFLPRISAYHAQVEFAANTKRKSGLIWTHGFPGDWRADESLRLWRLK
jgi:hypothetical protein